MFKRFLMVMGVVGGMVAGNLFAQTIVPGGNVSGTWTAAGSPYLIEGEITVPSSETLIIEPGVDVIFQGHYKLIVNGLLLAEGTEEDSILFTAADTSEGWHGIRFINAPDSSHLEYCVIEYGKSGGLELDNQGGGIYLLNSSLTISNSTFRNCFSEWIGGAIFSYFSSLDISNTTFFGNYCLANNNGGGGAIHSSSSKSTFLNCSFTTNSTEQKGGAIYFESDTSSVIDCYFYNNHALGGGAINSGTASMLEILNNLIIDNSAGFLGGGIAGGINSTLMVTNNTLVGNSAGYGGAYSTDRMNGSTFLNNIIWSNYPDQIYIYSTPGPVVNYSNIQGGWPGIGNVDEDPLFVSSPNGDYYLSQISAGQAQQSPCVDTGDPASPLIEGTTRTDGFPDADIVDMGFHYPLFSMPTPFLTVLLTPESLPILIPENGGSFDFTIEITNNYDSTVVFDAWIDITLPSGTPYGPVLMRRDLTIGPLDSISRQLTQSVGPGAPAGEYSYNASVGDYPFEVWSQDSFPFTKEGSNSDAGYMSSLDWQLTGWEDPTSMNTSSVLPEQFSVSAYPNPFNPTTTISFNLPQACRVRLEVFDITGKRVGVGLAPTRQYPAGTHHILFDGSDLASGIYIYRLQTGDFNASPEGRAYASGKMVLMK